MRLKKWIKKATALILVTGLTLSMTGCFSLKDLFGGNINNGGNGNTGGNTSGSDVSFDEFCDEVAVYLISSNALEAHYQVTDAEDYGVTFEDDDYTLGTLSEADNEEEIDTIAGWIKTLTAYEDELTDEDDQLTYDILMWYLETNLNYEGSYYLQNAFAPSCGVIANLSTNFTEYVFYEKEDIEHYFSLVESVPAYMESIYEFTREQSARGYFMADYLVDEVIEECDQYLEADANPYLVSFENKIEAMDGLTDAEKSEYIEKNETLVEQDITPAYSDSKSLLQELKGTGKDLGGLCNYGDIGTQYYEAILREKTSSDLSASAIISLLDDTMDDIIFELYQIIAIDPDAYDEFCSYSADYSNPTDVIEYILDNMGEDFPTPVTTNYSVDYLSEAEEVEGTVAYYMKARIDDTSHNSIKVNGDAVGDDGLTLYTTLAHEGYPGHLYQYTAMYDNENMSTVRKLMDFIGSTEGWAEYAADCTLSYLGVSDNVQRLMEINDMIGYIASSRIDLGVNYEGWTKEDVSEYAVDYFDLDDDVLDSLYYSVIGDPGELIPYTTGHIMMDQLRDMAEDELGDAFDAKAYHSFIIEEIGVAPFPIYEDKIDEWIAANK